MLDYHTMYPLVLESDLSADELLQVQDEPALEIALPQVFAQPSLVTLQRGKLANIGWLVARLHQRVACDRAGTIHAGEEVPGAAGRPAALGPDYQTLVNEFQPLFTWGLACWDFLLTTEGCRFIPRMGGDRSAYRSDYRVFTDADFSRLLHRVFRQCVLEFAQTAVEESLSGYLRARFWEQVRASYQRLEQPPDPRQRKLTAYSYLRCVPYQFLNDYHHELVHRTLRQLSAEELSVVQAYFLQFGTPAATADAVGRSVEDTETVLRRALTSLLIEHRLVYCLLRQIERY